MHWLRKPLQSVDFSFERQSSVALYVLVALVIIKIASTAPCPLLVAADL